MSPKRSERVAPPPRPGEWEIRYGSTDGRIWYLVDDDAHTVWLVVAGPGHPKATD